MTQLIWENNRALLAEGEIGGAAWKVDVSLAVIQRSRIVKPAMPKPFGVFRDLLLLSDRVDAGKHFYENAVIRPSASMDR